MVGPPAEGFGLEPGTRLPVFLDQIIDRRPGPHRVGEAELLPDQRLAVWIGGSFTAGQTARALMDDDVLDVVVSDRSVRLCVLDGGLP